MPLLYFPAQVQVVQCQRLNYLLPTALYVLDRFVPAPRLDAGIGKWEERDLAGAGVPGRLEGWGVDLDG